MKAVYTLALLACTQVMQLGCVHCQVTITTAVSVQHIREQTFMWLPELLHNGRDGWCFLDSIATCGCVHVVMWCTD